MTSELIKIGISGMFLLNSRLSSSSLLWDIWISERFCIKNALFWGDDTNRVVNSNSNYQFQFQLSVFNSNSNYAFSRFSIPIPITKNKTNSNSNYAAKFSIPIPIPTKFHRFFAILKLEIKLINCNSFLNCSMLSKFILKSKTLVILFLTN